MRTVHGGAQRESKGESVTQHIYRITVDRWPTDNGAPFTQQSSEYWERIVDQHHDPKQWEHSWVPDLDPCLYDRDDFGSLEYPEERGAMVLGTNGQPLLNVPSLTRRQFFARHAAVSRLDQLRRWGVSARIERAEIGAWS